MQEKYACGFSKAEKVKKLNIEPPFMDCLFNDMLYKKISGVCTWMIKGIQVGDGFNLIRIAKYISVIGQQNEATQKCMQVVKGRN